MPCYDRTPEEEREGLTNPSARAVEQISKPNKKVFIMVV